MTHVPCQWLLSLKKYLSSLKQQRYSAQTQVTVYTRHFHALSGNFSASCWMILKYLGIGCIGKNKSKQEIVPYLKNEIVEINTKYCQSSSNTDNMKYFRQPKIKC